MANRWGNSGNSGWLYFSGLQNHCTWWLQPWNLKKDACSLEEKLWPTFSSVQSLSHVWLFATPWFAARWGSLSIINSQSSLRLTTIGSVIPSSHLILCLPLLLQPPIPPSVRVFSNESTLRMRWPAYYTTLRLLSISGIYQTLQSESAYNIFRRFRRHLF